MTASLEWTTKANLPLLSNASATGDPWHWGGGSGTFKAVSSNWNGGGCKLQCLGPDGTSWIDVGTDTTLSANGGGNFELSPGRVRAAITGSPTGVYASAVSHGS